MKKHTRLSLVIAIFVLMALLIPLSAVFADSTVTVDFSTYPNGTSASHVTAPNITFASTGTVPTILATGGWLFQNGSGTIQIKLTRPAKSINLNYFFGGECAGTASVEIFLKGVSLDKTTIGICNNGTYTQTQEFDRLVFTNNYSVQSQIVLYSPMTFIFPDPPPVTTTTTTTTAAPIDVQFTPNDDRLNHTTSDRAAPVAIFCEPHGIQVRRIDPVTSVGIDPPALNVFFADINAAGIPTDKNILLAQNDGVSLYRLTTGEFQVNVLDANSLEYKWFVFVWDQCPVPTHSYHIDLKG